MKHKIKLNYRKTILQFEEWIIIILNLTVNCMYRDNAHSSLSISTNWFKLWEKVNLITRETTYKQHIDV